MVWYGFVSVDTTLVKCPECNSRKLVYDENRGERHCNECGMVIEDAMTIHMEWRTFTQDGGGPDRSRVGAPTTNLFHDKGLSTEIDWQNKDFSGSH